MTHNLSLLAIAVAVPLALTSCGGDSSSSGKGTLNVSMTDAPSCGFDHVYVTVDRVRVHASANANAFDAGWSEVVLPVPQKIDLLDLSNGVLHTLGQTPLPEGHYQQIRLLLEPNHGSNLANSIVPTGGLEQELTTPSATQSGYKVVGSFDVQADKLVDLVLDFDACHSIVQRGNGTYALKPVVKATTMVVSGSITGYVDPSEAGASVYAEQNGVIVKATVADLNGKFVLSPVVQSSSNGAYDVVIEQADHASAVVLTVPVIAGANTPVSTSLQPFLLPASAMSSVSGTVTPASAQAFVDALQMSGSGVFTLASVTANLDTGVYSMSLPAGPLLVGSYSSTLPIVLSADAAAAGQYKIQATSSSGVMQASNVDVSTSNASNVNFNF